MQYKTLEDISVADLVHVFNEAFSDYLVPIHLTKEQLLNKIISESIRKELSVGAFEGDKLVAFILHGIDTVKGDKTAYNAGTGVLPENRGNKLTYKLYEHAFPILKKNGVKKINLEVIAENEAAKKVYSGIGFTKTRSLNCYKGSISDLKTHSTVYVQHIYHPDWKILETFWDWTPSWQNSVSAINKSWSLLDTFGIFNENELLGYCVYNPKLNRIHQFAIDKNHRKSGLGRQLFQYLSLNKSKTVSLINIDNSALETNSFLSNAGLEIFIRQDEMELVF